MSYCLETDGPITTQVDITWLRRIKEFGPRTAQEIPIGTVSRLSIAGFIRAEEAEGVISAKYGARIMRHIQYRISQQGENYLANMADDKTVEFIERFAAKGQYVRIEGKARQSSYEKNGNTVYTTEVLGFRFDFCEPKGAGDEGVGDEEI